MFKGNGGVMDKSAVLVDNPAGCKGNALSFTTATPDTNAIVSPTFGTTIYFIIFLKIVQMNLWAIKLLINNLNKNYLLVSPKGYYRICLNFYGGKTDVLSFRT